MSSPALPAAATGAHAPRHLILGSSSPYRRELLQRLRLPFECHSPSIDESPQPGEAPADTARRLALAKAHAVAAQQPGAVVIGSDQVAELNGQPLGKPGTHERAVAQLRAMSGQQMHFHTAVAVLDAQGLCVGQALNTVRVRLRTLSEAEIEHYLRAEQPYDCAGSAKVEGLGITLLEAVESDDPTALIGLPLIATTTLLRRAGFALPGTGGAA
jgi:septum formation protein